ncbi:MAG: hypothetical protein LBG44_04585 [Gemmatimonadota bacterium]|jgi:hypothetical protein|nr:hypothetical protein [Gemmatimonadota bacterium]
MTIASLLVAVSMLVTPAVTSSAVSAGLNVAPGAPLPAAEELVSGRVIDEALAGAARTEPVLAMAQAAPAEAVAPPEEGTPAVEAGVVAPEAAAAVPSGLPTRQPPPRTLHAFWPVFAGFALAMAGIVALLVTRAGARHARLVRMIQELEESSRVG